jgi:hypothetical protein
MLQARPPRHLCHGVSDLPLLGPGTDVDPYDGGQLGDVPAGFLSRLPDDLPLPEENLRLECVRDTACRQPAVRAPADAAQGSLRDPAQVDRRARALDRLEVNVAVRYLPHRTVVAHRAGAPDGLQGVQALLQLGSPVPPGDPGSLILVR